MVFRFFHNDFEIKELNITFARPTTHIFIIYYINTSMNLSRSLAVILLAGFAVTAWAGNDKLSSHTRTLLTGLDIRSKTSASRIGAVKELKIMVILNPGHSFGEIEPLGACLSCRISDDIFIADIPVDKLENIAASPAVKEVDSGAPVGAYLNQARSATFADAAIEGAASEGFTSAYRGKGVIAGIFDSGIDPGHVTFEDADGKSRVAAYYNYVENRLYSGDGIKSASTDNASETHGTHCAGIMAGNGAPAADKVIGITSAFAQGTGAGPIVLDNQVGNPYYGMAREAEIYLAGGSLTDANILDAAGKIRDYARSKGKPAVLNLSLGSIAGPHDGSGTFNRALAEIGKDVIICIAAGNDGNRKMAVRKAFTSSSAILKTSTSYDQNGEIDNLFEFWADDSRQLTGELALYDTAKGQTTTVCTIDNGYKAIVTSDISGNYTRNSAFDKAFTQSQASVYRGVNSNNKRAYIQISLALECSAANSSGTIVPLFIIKGSAGQRIDGYSNLNFEFTSHGISDLTDGITSESINNYACSENVIAVGAFTSRNMWPALSRQYFSFTNRPAVGSLCDFSSHGTTFSGTTLPHICAPGSAIISSFSHFYTDKEKFTTSTSNASAYCTKGGATYYFGAMQGTSQAAPMVAGAAALMLQADPALRCSDVREILRATATKDTDVTSAASIAWGAGKLNVKDAMKRVLNISGVDGVTADDPGTRIITTVSDGSVSIFYADAPQFEVSLHSVSGTRVAAARASDCNATISTSALPSGIYILDIATPGGHVTRKIVLQ